MLKVLVAMHFSNRKVAQGYLNCDCQQMSFQVNIQGHALRQIPPMQTLKRSLRFFA